MYHTHMRPDRDDFVTVNWNNIVSGKKGEFENCRQLCDTHGSPYDCDSVMHYASNQMSKNGKDTLSKMLLRTDALAYSDTGFSDTVQGPSGYSDTFLISQMAFLITVVRNVWIKVVNG